MLTGSLLLILHSVVLLFIACSFIVSHTKCDSSTVYIVHCRYSYVDMDDDKKSHRPPVPKSVGYNIVGFWGDHQILPVSDRLARFDLVV